MAYDPDELNPLDSAQVSAFPANERASRAAFNSLNGVEHSDSEGRHKFGRGSTGTRNGISTWVVGSIWINTSRISGEEVIDIYDGAAWVETSFGIADISQEWTKVQYAPYVTMETTSSALDLDWDDGTYQKFTMDGSYTLGAGTNMPATGKGASIVLELTQDGVGSNTLAYNAEYVGIFGTTPTLTTTAAAVDILDLTILSTGSVLVTARLDAK